MAVPRDSRDVATSPPLPTAGTTPEFTFHEYGDAGVLVEVHSTSSEAQWASAQALGASARRADRVGVVGIVDVVAAFDTVFVGFDPLVTSHEEMCAALTSLVGDAHEQPAPRCWNVPVVYGGDFGPDLVSLAAMLGESSESIIQRHLEATWTIRLVGSPVGSPMMDGGGGPSSVPRLSAPRPRVSSGSVGLSGHQSMIYTAASPGGWQLIGRTPARLFDIEQPPHVAYRPGDQVRFERVPPDRFEPRAASPLCEIDPPTPNTP